MKEPRRDLFGHFPMQAALELYSLHKYVPDDEDDEEDDEGISIMPPSEKEVPHECILRNTTSATTKDTKR